jgi:hypothetical protein
MTAVARAWPAWTEPRARPADAAVFALARLCLVGFLAAQFLSLARLFFVQHLGGLAAAVASQAGLLSVGLLLPAVVGYGLRDGSLLGRLTEPARLWIGAVTALAVALFAYGWVHRGYEITAALHDLAPYLTIAGCVVLGSMPRALADADRPLLVLFALGLVVNALGMTEMTRVVTEAQADDRAGIAIVGYRTQGALAFWPLLFLTARLRGRTAQLLVCAGVWFVLAQQVLFQKRSPTFRIALFLAVFFVVLPLVLRGRDAEAERRVRGSFAATGAAAIAIALCAAPWLFQGQVMGLWDRISGQRYSGGAAGMLTWENERFYEARMFFATLEPPDWAIGRGFGGYFVPDDPEWGVWLEDVGEYGRRQLHVGGLMPFFKGGLALTLTYYAGLALALLRGRRAVAEPFTAAAFFVVLLHAVFLLQEGWFVMSMSFDLAMVGLCMGHLLSRERALAAEAAA